MKDQRVGSVKNDTRLGMCDAHRDGQHSKKSQAGRRVGAEHEFDLGETLLVLF